MLSNKSTSRTTSKVSPTRELTTVSTESQDRLNERVESLAIALATNSSQANMNTPAAQPSSSSKHINFRDIITSGGTYNSSEEENDTSDEHSKANDSYYKSLLLAGAETINDSYKGKIKRM